MECVRGRVYRAQEFSDYGRHAIRNSFQGVLFSRYLSLRERINPSFLMRHCTVSSIL